MLTGGQDYGTQLDIACNALKAWALRRSSLPDDGRPRELAAYGPVVATDDRSKLYARTVTVHGNIQRTSPSTCKGAVQRTTGSDGNRCYVDTCKHVPQANSPPPTAAHLCMLLAEVGQVNGLLTVSQVHETSLWDVQ
jgi:hypothetical protein